MNASDSFRTPGVVVQVPAPRIAPSGPRLWLPLTAFFLLMLGIGWIPDGLLKLAGSYSVSLGEVLLMVAVVVNVRLVLERLARRRLRTAMDVVIVALLAAVTINVIRNVGAGYPFVQVLRNARRMFYYTLFFVLVAYIRDRETLVRLLKGFSVLFIVGAVSYFLAFFFDIPLASRIAIAQMPGGGSFERIYHVIFPMAVVVGLLHYALLLTGARNSLGVSSSAILAIASVLVYLSHYRNYYLTYLLGLGVITVAASGLRLRSLLKAGGRLAAVAAVVVGALAATGDLQRTLERASTLGEEITMGGGTVGSRLIIWGIRYETIRNLNLLLGAGFIWEQDVDRTADDVILDALVPDNDNGYAAALVLLGAVGIVLFLFLYFAAFRLALKQLRCSRGAVDRALCLTAIGLVPYVLISNIGLDNFHWPYAVLPNIVILAALNALAVHDALGEETSPQRGAAPDGATE